MMTSSAGQFTLDRGKDSSKGGHIFTAEFKERDNGSNLNSMDISNGHQYINSVHRSVDYQEDHSYEHTEGASLENPAIASNEEGAVDP